MLQISDCLWYLITVMMTNDSKLTTLKKTMQERKEYCTKKQFTGNKTSANYQNYYDFGSLSTDPCHANYDHLNAVVRHLLDQYLLFFCVTFFSEPVYCLCK